MAENKMEQVESLLKWLASGEKDEDGNCLGDNDTQLVCEALEYYLNMHGQKNKMAQVAALFGKKLGERFCIIRYGVRYDARFLERGFEVYGLANPYVDMDAFVLADLLTGWAEIVEDEDNA